MLLWIPFLPQKQSVQREILWPFLPGSKQSLHCVCACVRAFGRAGGQLGGWAVHLWATCDQGEDMVAICDGPYGPVGVLLF